MMSTISSEIHSQVKRSAVRQPGLKSDQKPLDKSSHQPNVAQSSLRSSEVSKLFPSVATVSMETTRKKQLFKEKSSDPCRES